MKIEDLLREAAIDGPEADCGPGVEFRLRQQVRQRQRWRIVQGLAAIAAAAALAVILWRTPAPVAAPLEVATPFYAIDPASVHGIRDGYLMRVRVPRSMMVSFGLPVHEEAVDSRVEADLIVGDDGTARAIRFVHPARGQSARGQYQ